MNWAQRINPAWFLAGAAFFLPIKPAPVNLFLLLAVIFTVTIAEHRSKIARLFSEPVLLPLWLLLGFLALTFFYSSTNQASYFDFVSKYGRLALVPVLAAVLIPKTNRELVGKGFLTGMAIVLGMSYGIWLGVDPALFGVTLNGSYPNPSNPTVYKAHITHNFFLVIAIYLWIVCAIQSNKLGKRLFYIALVFLGLVNLFGMIDGRTGWLVFMVIPLYFGYRKFGVPGVLLAGLVFLALLISAFFLIPNVHDRFMTGWVEIHQVLQSSPRIGTSVGERVVFLTSSWQAFLKAPLLGYGLGGIEAAVQPFTSAIGWPVFHNPHNQFFMLILQGGLLALSLYAWFFGALIWKSTRQAWTEIYVLPLLLMYFAGNLVNSFHFDFAESVGIVLIVAILVAGLAARSATEEIQRPYL